MPDKPISYRVNPLPQADYPVNLYKRSPSRTASADRPQVATPLTIYSIESPPQPPRLESSRPRQSPASRQQQQAEAKAIAQRVRDTSGSSRLEFLLRRQQGKRYSQYERCQPSRKLEHLAIALRPDQRYQIAIQGTKKPFSRHVFETVQYCSEAAAELEQKFALGGMLEFLDSEIQEHVEAIVLAAIWRERVELELAVA
jgi:hypothetical protein